MCGVAGVLHLDGKPAAPVLVRRMASALVHRGPDGEGIYVQGPVGLGHRRLAILDLSPAGQQPMRTPEGRYVISYNGEVYNFRELRAELEALGWQFRSQTDTEVVLTAYAQWGEEALARFNGMFAFAIWDEHEGELMLARDRYGTKPLYYTLRGETFLFGSEIKAILAHPAYETELDVEALLEYFTFQNFFTDRTLFQDVRLLPAGTTLRLRRGRNSSPRVRRYWDFQFSEPAEQLAEGEYLEELDRLFRQAVNRQLVSDVEVGAYLSGGMDSGSITALASQQLPYMKTFTCGFDLHSASGLEIGFDERKKAEYMSYLYKTEHYEMVLKAGDMERVLGDLAWHLEEPRVGQSYPNYYAARLASRFVKVCLSGAGGDELFAGYPWRYYKAVVNDSFEDYIDKYYVYWQRLIPNEAIRRVFNPVWAEVEHVWTRDIFRDVFAWHADRLTRPEDYVNHSLYLEAKTFLNGLLVVEDKLSMAHGLEVRVPFLDNDLVDFATRVPVGLKLGNLENVVRGIDENEPGDKPSKYFDQMRDGKLILRKAMRRHVPEQVTQIPKQGFSGPDASWFKGESIDFVRAKLYRKDALIYEYLDRGALQGLLDEHLDGRKNRRLLVWSALSVEAWLERFTRAPAIGGTQ